MIDKIANTVYLLTVVSLFAGAMTQNVDSVNRKVSDILGTIFCWLFILSFVLIPTQILIAIWSN
jgi:hypothetical protein